MVFVNPYGTGAEPDAQTGTSRRAGAVVAVSAASLVAGSGAAQAVGFGDITGVSTVGGSSFPDIGTSTSTPLFTVVPPVEVASIDPGSLSLSTPSVSTFTVPTVVTPPPLATSSTPVTTPTAVTTPAPGTTPAPESTPAPVTTSAPETSPAPGTGSAPVTTPPASSTPTQPVTATAVDGRTPDATRDTIHITPTTDLDRVQPSVPEQAPFVELLRTTEGQEAVAQLFDTTYTGVDTSEDLQCVIAATCQQLRDLALATSPVQDAAQLYPTVPEEDIATLPLPYQRERASLQNEVNQAAQQAAAQAPSGFQACEIACTLVREDDGTARVTDLMIGVPGAVSDQGTLTASTSCVDAVFCHTHPLDIGYTPEGAPWAIDQSGLSVPDAESTTATQEASDASGSDAQLSVASVSLLEGQVTWLPTPGFSSDTIVTSSTPGVPVSSGAANEFPSTMTLGDSTVTRDGTTVEIPAEVEAEGASDQRYDTARSILRPTLDDLVADATNTAVEEQWYRDLAGVPSAPVVEPTGDGAPDGPPLGGGPTGGGVTITPEIQADTDGIEPDPTGGTTSPPVPPGQQVLPPTPSTTPEVQAPGTDQTPSPSGTTTFPTADQDLTDALDGAGGVPGLFPGAPVTDQDRPPTATGDGTEPEAVVTTELVVEGQDVRTTVREYLPDGTERLTAPDGTVTIEPGTPDGAQARTDAFYELADTVERVNRTSGEALGTVVQSTVDAAGATADALGTVLTAPLLPLVGSGDGGTTVFSGP